MFSLYRLRRAISRRLDSRIVHSTGGGRHDKPVDGPAACLPPSARMRSTHYQRRLELVQTTEQPSDGRPLTWTAYLREAWWDWIAPDRDDRISAFVPAGVCLGAALMLGVMATCSVKAPGPTSGLGLIGIGLQRSFETDAGLTEEIAGEVDAPERDLVPGFVGTKEGGLETDA